jgi:hypothetical protein
VTNASQSIDTVEYLMFGPRTPKKPKVIDAEKATHVLCVANKFFCNDHMATLDELKARLQDVFANSTAEIEQALKILSPKFNARSAL